MDQKRILLCYKNFSKETNVSHIGLGVTAINTAKTLIKHGYQAQAIPIFGADDLSDQLIQMGDVSHVLIMAQWIPSFWLAQLCRTFPQVQFGMKCHSNIGFLQAEPPAIDLLRQAIDLETGLPNFHCCTNSERLQTALQNMYGRPITYLPNLYYIHGKEPIHRPLWNGGILRIGCFGALRVYKNFSTAIAASIELTNQLKCHSEIWINSGRDDGAGNTVFRTAVAWTKGLPNVTLKELHWASWPEFKRVVGSMNILLQPSYTETFNNVTADGICEGVPSVVGPAIEWVPSSCIAEPDDSSQVAGVARRLLFDPHAANEGYQALTNYLDNGIGYWKSYLERLI